MKSEATKTQAAQAVYSLSSKATRQDPRPRSGKSAQLSSSLKNEYVADRKERGRSPTVRALIWEAGMTQVKPMPPMTTLKKAAQVQHVEFALPANGQTVPRPQGR